MIGRIHLNTIFKGWFLIGKLDFYIRRDVPHAVVINYEYNMYAE